MDALGLEKQDEEREDTEARGRLAIRNPRINVQVNRKRD